MYDDQNFNNYNNYDGYNNGYNEYEDWNMKNKLQSLVNSAFVKGLISAILCQMPIGSIVAIFLGAAANRGVKKADELARQMGTKAGGKRIVAKILGMVGMFTGIFYTLFWILYFVWILALIGGIFDGGYSSYGYYYY